MLKNCYPIAFSLAVAFSIAGCEGSVEPVDTTPPVVSPVPANGVDIDVDENGVNVDVGPQAPGANAVDVDVD